MAEPFFIPTGSVLSCSGSVSKESACNAGDPGLIPGSGKSPGEGKGYSLQYSGLGNPMDSTGVTKTERLSLSLHFDF